MILGGIDSAWRVQANSNIWILSLILNFALQPSYLTLLFKLCYSTLLLNFTLQLSSTNRTLYPWHRYTKHPMSKYVLFPRDTTRRPWAYRGRCTWSGCTQTSSRRFTRNSTGSSARTGSAPFRQMTSRKWSTSSAPWRCVTGTPNQCAIN